MNSQKFESDLQFGANGENIIINYLTGLGLKFINDSKSLCDDYDFYKSFDLLFQNKSREFKKFEIKTDKYADTGNLPVEFKCNGKDSGIRTTKSDFILFYFTQLEVENIWIIKTSRLKEIINENQFHFSYGGDDNKSCIYLINRNEFKDDFRIYSLSRSEAKKMFQIKQKRYKMNDSLLRLLNLI